MDLETYRKWAPPQVVEAELAGISVNTLTTYLYGSRHDGKPGSAPENTARAIADAIRVKFETLWKPI